jgi:hypothetical protein
VFGIGAVKLLLEKAASRARTARILNTIAIHRDRRSAGSLLNGIAVLQSLMKLTCRGGMRIKFKVRWSS